MQTPIKQNPRPAATGARANNRKQQRNYNTIVREIIAILTVGSMIAVMVWQAVFGMADDLASGPGLEIGNVMVAMLTKRKKHPPYWKCLKPNPNRTLWILYGPEAWDIAASETWMRGEKVVLPNGKHPSEFDWSFSAGFADAVIVAEKTAPPFDVVKSLAGELLAHIDVVLYLDPRVNCVKFNADEVA
jgi:hypothetical protein